MTAVFMFILLLFSIYYCSSRDVIKEASIDFNSFEKQIDFVSPSDELLTQFNREIIGDSIEIKKGEKFFNGYITSNRSFLEEVITPILQPQIEKLRRKHPVEIVNDLAIFGYEIFRTYFDREFYRWGGDIFDLDDPQIKGTRYKNKFGLDCSGYAALPYELAVHFNLIDSAAALFSSTGYKIFCGQKELEDTGGREDTPNNYRLDTKEMILLGEEIIRINKGTEVSDEQIKLLQPGDIAGRSGHFGIIIEIEGKPYYLESGGRIVPSAGYLPVEAQTALTAFARNGYVSVRRCLPSIK